MGEELGNYVHQTGVGGGAGGGGCMAVRWCGVWSSAAVGVWTGRSLYVGWLCQPKRKGGRAETGEREGSVFMSAKKAYYTGL